MSAPDPSGLRRAYADAGLAESDLARDPFAQFARWFADATDAGDALVEPNAMVVSTVGPGGRPSARTVLMKAYDTRGFVFYTNYGSRKGRELTENPAVALTFPWYPLERQVIVTGDARRVGRDESGAYFATRPHGSQLGAWASEQQSAPVASRAELDRRYDEVQRRWPDGTDVPLPDFWGGFLVVPATVEFWQGRGSRMHDRLRYVRTEGDRWTVERLSP